MTPNDMVSGLAFHPDAFKMAIPSADTVDVLIGYGKLRNPDAHLGAEEKPYRPLVNIRHYGQNSHWSGRGQR